MTVIKLMGCAHQYDEFTLSHAWRDFCEGSFYARVIEGATTEIQNSDRTAHQSQSPQQSTGGYGEPPLRLGKPSKPTGLIASYRRMSI